MSNDFFGRMQNNWKRRSGERSTFADEFRLVPRWLVLVVVFLYGLALAIAAYVTITDPGALLRPLVDKPFAVQLLAMAGIVTAAAVPVAAIIFLIGYISQDAKRRGMNAVLWVLLSIFIPNLIGVIIYFIVREPLPFSCPKCGALVTAQFNYCPRCQHNLRPNCPQCRREVQLGDRFCPHCGAAMEPAAPVPSAPAGAPR